MNNVQKLNIIRIASIFLILSGLYNIAFKDKSFFGIVFILFGIVSIRKFVVCPSCNKSIPITLNLSDNSVCPNCNNRLDIH